VSKSKKKSTVPPTPRADPRMWRVNQRAHKFATPTNKYACRKNKGKSNREDD
jgi:hypothetical protein